MPDWNAGMPHLRVRRSGRRAVPGQTLERGKGRNQVAASIKEQDCDRQINKIYRDKMAAYLSSFYGTVSLHTGTIQSKTLREAVMYMTGFRQRAFYGSGYSLKERVSLASPTDKGARSLSRSDADRVLLS